MTMRYMLPYLKRKMPLQSLCRIKSNKNTWDNYIELSGWSLNTITYIYVRRQKKTGYIHEEDWRYTYTRKAILLWRQRSEWCGTELDKMASKARRGKGDILPSVFWGTVALPLNLDFNSVILMSSFWPPEVWENEYIYCLSHQGCGHLWQS